MQWGSSSENANIAVKNGACTGQNDEGPVCFTCGYARKEGEPCEGCSFVVPAQGSFPVTGAHTLDRETAQAVDVVPLSSYVCPCCGVEGACMSDDGLWRPDGTVDFQVLLDSPFKARTRWFVREGLDFRSFTFSLWFNFLTILLTSVSNTVVADVAQRWIPGFNRESKRLMIKRLSQICLFSVDKLPKVIIMSFLLLLPGADAMANSTALVTSEARADPMWEYFIFFMQVLLWNFVLLYCAVYNAWAFYNDRLDALINQGIRKCLSFKYEARVCTGLMGAVIFFVSYILIIVAIKILIRLGFSRLPYWILKTIINLLTLPYYLPKVIIKTIVAFLAKFFNFFKRFTVEAPEKVRSVVQEYAIGEEILDLLENSIVQQWNKFEVDAGVYVGGFTEEARYESTVPSSVFIACDDTQPRIIANKDGIVWHHSMCWRYKSFLVFCRHGLDEQTKYVLKVKDRHLDLKWQNMNFKFDICFYPLRDQEISLLQLRALQPKVITPGLSCAVEVFGYHNLRSWRSLGMAEYDLEKDNVYHYASTDKGWSGTPVLCGNTVLGMHAQGLNGKNVAYPIHLIEALAPTSQPAAPIGAEAVKWQQKYMDGIINEYRRTQWKMGAQQRYSDDPTDLNVYVTVPLNGRMRTMAMTEDEWDDFHEKTQRAYARDHDPVYAQDVDDSRGDSYGADYEEPATVRGRRNRRGGKHAEMDYVREQEQEKRRPEKEVDTSRRPDAEDEANLKKPKRQRKKKQSVDKKKNENAENPNEIFKTFKYVFCHKPCHVEPVEVVVNDPESKIPCPTGLVWPKVEAQDEKDSFAFHETRVNKNSEKRHVSSECLVAAESLYSPLKIKHNKNWNSKENFLRAMESINKKGSPGQPLMQIKGTNEDLIEHLGVDGIWTLVQKRIEDYLNPDLDPTEVADEVRVFVKREAHTKEKAALKRWRLIWNVALIDQIVDRMLWQDLQDVSTRNWENTPNACGFSLTEGGWNRLFRSLRIDKPDDTDMGVSDYSSMDWTYTRNIMEDADELKLRLIVGSKSDKAFLRLVEARRKAVSIKKVSFSDGTVYKQLEEYAGLNPSGRFMTLFDNSVAGVLHVIETCIKDDQMIFPLKGLGDDNLHRCNFKEESFKSVSEELGFILKYHEVGKIWNLDFGSTGFKRLGDQVVPIPVNLDKHEFTWQRRPSMQQASKEVLVSMLTSYCALYAFHDKFEVWNERLAELDVRACKSREYLQTMTTGFEARVNPGDPGWK